MNLYLRIIFSVLLIFSVIYGWWLIVLVLGLYATWYFKYFFEFILAGIFFDSLYGYSADLGFWSYGGTIITTLLFIIFVYLKKILRKSDNL